MGGVSDLTVKKSSIMQSKRGRIVVYKISTQI